MIEDIPDTTVCRSPIEMNRIDPLGVTIRFPDRWLGFEVGKNAKRSELLNLLREIQHPQECMVHVIANSIAIIIFVGVDGKYSPEAEETLNGMVQKVIRTALIYFGKNHGDTFEQREDGYIERIYIPERLTEVFQKTGVQNDEEFENWTREELCRLPEIRTNDVLILELELSARGIFLKDSPLPPYWR